MIRNLKACLCLAGSMFALQVSAEAIAVELPDYVDVAKSGLTRMDTMDTGGNWFFTVTAHLDDEVLISRNDPWKEEGLRRELLSVNGEPPTAERLAEFQKRELDRAKNEDEETVRVQFSDMVDLSTLAVTKVENGQVYFSFTPDLDDFEQDNDRIKGTLLLNADTQLIEALQLVNTEKISPAFSVSVKTFTMDVSFSPIEGEPLLTRMESNIEGKVGFLKNFKSETVLLYSDYRRKE